MEEIKAGDIMLNNWFHVNGYPMYVDSIFRDTVYLEFEGNEGDVWEENIKDLKPIPLTEDILLKAGFGEKDDQYYLIIQTGVSSNAVYFEFEIVNGDVFGSMWIDKETENTRKIFLEVKYVHQLQNLLFILSGNQLIINI